jgi:hypothetical protein
MVSCVTRSDYCTFCGVNKLYTNDESSVEDGL